jgi:hypothetical protein
MCESKRHQVRRAVPKMKQHLLGFPLARRVAVDQRFDQPTSAGSGHFRHLSMHSGDSATQLSKTPMASPQAS